MFGNLFKSKKSEAKKLDFICNNLKTLYKVDELQDTIDHRIAKSYEGINATQGQAIHEMLEQ